MADQEKRPDGREAEEWTPASPAKRVIAWVGVVYMVCLVLMNLYPFYTAGRYLTGIGPLLVCPGVVGLGILCAIQLRRAECPTWKRCVLAGLIALCAIVCLMGLVDGVPALIAGLRG